MVSLRRAQIRLEGKRCVAFSQPCFFPSFSVGRLSLPRSPVPSLAMVRMYMVAVCLLLGDRVMRVLRVRCSPLDQLRSTSESRGITEGWLLQLLTLPLLVYSSSHPSLPPAPSFPLLPPFYLLHPPFYLLHQLLPLIQHWEH